MTFIGVSAADDPRHHQTTRIVMPEFRIEDFPIDIQETFARLSPQNQAPFAQEMEPLLDPRPASNPPAEFSWTRAPEMRVERIAPQRPETPLGERTRPLSDKELSDYADEYSRLMERDLTLRNDRSILAGRETGFQSKRHWVENPNTAGRVGTVIGTGLGLLGGPVAGIAGSATGQIMGEMLASGDLDALNADIRRLQDRRTQVERDLLQTRRRLREIESILRHDEQNRLRAGQ